jgi:hypothetical protein
MDHKEFHEKFKASFDKHHAALSAKDFFGEKEDRARMKDRWKSLPADHPTKKEVPDEAAFDAVADKHYAAKKNEFYNRMAHGSVDQKTNKKKVGLGDAVLNLVSGHGGAEDAAAVKRHVHSGNKLSAGIYHDMTGHKFQTLKGLNEHVDALVAKPEVKKSEGLISIREVVKRAMEKIGASYEAPSSDSTSLKKHWAIVPEQTPTELKKAWELKKSDDLNDKVIGKTKSGKEIHSTFEHPAHQSFSKQDHQDAVQLHIETGEKYYHADKEKYKHHDLMAVRHSKAKINAATLKKSDDLNDKVIGKTKSGKEIHSTFEHPAHQSFSKQDHQDAVQLHIETGEKYYHADKEKYKHHDLMAVRHSKAKINAATLKKSDDLNGKVEFAPNPGSAQVKSHDQFPIGKTQSGKPIYPTGASNPKYEDWTGQDHKDAEMIHRATGHAWREKHGAEKDVPLKGQPALKEAMHFGASYDHGMKALEMSKDTKKA